MKRKISKAVILTVAAIVTGGIARADLSPSPLPGQPPCCNPTVTLITAGNVASTPGAVAAEIGDYLWSYDFQVDNLSDLDPTHVANEYAVIYNFGHFVIGSETAPADWTASYQSTGPDPFGISASTITGLQGTGVDLVYTYAGTAVIGVNSQFVFTAISTNNVAVTGGFGGQDWNYAFGREAGNAQSYTSLVPDGGGPVSLESTVPEPSSVILLASLLITVAAFARKKFSAQLSEN